MRSAVALVALGAVAVSAQLSETKFQSSLNMTIDPNSVTPAERASWCQAQTNSCYSLCDNDVDDIGCEQSDLSYDCTCSSNSSAPALQYYSQTMPNFICKELFSQCIEQNTGMQREQDDCKKNIDDVCGTVTVPTVDASEDGDDDDDSSSTTATSATTRATGTATETASGESATTTESDGLAAATSIPGAAVLAAAGLFAVLV